MKTLAPLLAFSLTLVGPASASAPAGRFTTTTDVVTDNVTGLKWQRVNLGTYDYANAQSYCANLGIGSMTGWRVPKVKELHSIVDVRAGNPAIDTTIFTQSAGTTFWTSTSSPTANSKYYIHFQSGWIAQTSTGATMSVRCVHD